jgi:hypothetical protein
VITLTLKLRSADGDRLQRVATRMRTTPQAFIKECIEAALASFDAPVDTAPAPATPAASTSGDLDTVWTPHRDAPSLITDLAPGVSAFPRSSLGGGTAHTRRNR